MSTGLQLIAIKPRQGCLPPFLKRLTVDTPYYFYQNYRIITFSEESEVIARISPRVPDLYQVRDEDGQPLEIQVSAIAGKNGSGKSSLVELLYVMLYNLSFRLDLLEKPRTALQAPRAEPGVYADIFYRLGDVFYRLRCESDLLYLSKADEDSRFDGRGVPVTDTAQLAELFYTVVINYSQYGLNTEEMGDWVQPIFHKNDGYQTPIVLNPYREAGTINIHSENYLVRSRLLVNILEGRAASLIFDGKPKIPKTFRFSFDASKTEVPEDLADIFKEFWGYFNQDILPGLFTAFYGPGDYRFPDSGLQGEAKHYIFRKLIRITEKYAYYRDYPQFFVPAESRQLGNFLIDLAEDPSHITFKLKQAMNFLRFNTLLRRGKDFPLAVSTLTQEVARIKLLHPDIPTIDLVPPSFFAADIDFSSRSDSFKMFSSGEKQKVYALSSLVYHLRNLDSVVERRYQKGEKKTLLVKYRHVNIIFDEVELYYHPELQRRFIKDLLDNIAQAGLQTISSINLLFVTHSPFILSDIPDQHILYLAIEDGHTVSQEREQKTFGGNIHDLLANSFFLDQHGYLGEFAKEKINSAVSWLRRRISPEGANPSLEPMAGPDSWDEAKVRALTELIGEPLIARSLRSLLAQAFPSSDEQLDEQIRQLQQQKLINQRNRNDRDSN